MVTATKIILPLLAYVVVTAVLFGNPVQPIALATLWPDRLGIAHWRLLALGCLAASAIVLVLPFGRIVPDTLRPAIFVILAVIAPTMLVGWYADGIRHRETLAFNADAIEEHSFFSSLHRAPAEFQDFLHTAVLKNCKPYAWSYKTLSFYELPSNIAINVLPPSWVTRCGIVRN